MYHFLVMLEVMCLLTAIFRR